MAIERINFLRSIVFSGVLTLLVLVFTEIIPKTLGTVHASSLVGFVGRTVLILTKLLAPVVAVTRALTRLFARHEVPAVSRQELAVLVATAAREGQLHVDESRLLANALRLDRVRVADVMTPWTVAVTLPATMTLGEFAHDRRTAAYSRFPVYEDGPDHVVGWVLQRELLRSLATGAQESTPVKRHLREIAIIPEVAPLPAALRAFLEKREHLAVVVDEYGSMAGLVTLEDVIETILGTEIVDEADAVVDLRVLATELRDARLAERRLLADGGEG